MGSQTWPQNIGMLFEHFADSPRPVFHLDRPLDIAPEEGTRFTVRALDEQVKRASGALAKAGVGPGDQVAVVKDNHLDIILLAAAAARVGALPALISATVPSADLAVMLERLGPKALVAAPSVLSAAAEAAVALVEPGVTVLAAGAGQAPPGAELFTEYTGAPVPPATPRPDHEPMICTHTSGTTGVPKLVVHSAQSMMGVLARMAAMMKLPGLGTQKDEVIASCIAYVHARAFAWIGETLLRPGSEVLVLTDPEPSSVATHLTRHPPTFVDASPNIYQRWEPLTETHSKLFSRTRMFINTFDAIHPGTVRKFLDCSERKRPIWGQAWGQSETGPLTMGVLTARAVRRARGKPDSVTSNVGRGVPRVAKFTVVDPETRQPLPAGTPGLLLAKTDFRALTYLGENDRFQEKDWDGWWNTGDIGTRSRTGVIRLVDREVDTIPGMSGIELESVLLDRLERATEIIILSSQGRRPVPVIATYDGELRPSDWARATGDLPAMEEPILIGWDEFPRTGTWKVRRHELRSSLLGSDDTYGTGRWT
ncbi:AMP-binding protein [Streptomyces sp. N2-109]|uniref:AMP-binding protein n=1 Tax=Streptomyces gossypii TaxID=2883101 RepID=A0ABT2JPF0_9ACTN|nr:AMP-binding protein [Streptomyces gossypii]MCT2589616.1 AMP-binding protein [Streptomyces gossypii]